MGTTIFGSLRAVILARPPIVTFALSLMAITVTIFLVAFYFKNKNVISDVQAEEDWASFKHHLNQQKFCVSESGTHPLPSVLTNEVKSIASQVNNAAFFYAVVNGWRTNQMWLSDSGSAIGVALTGVTNLEGWERSCHYQNDLLTLESTKLTITIIIPNLKLFNNSHLSCVYVKAPSYLHWPATRKSKSVGNSAESLRDQCEIAVADIKTSLPLLSGNKEQGDDSGCEKVDIFQLSYDFGEYESNIYLTKDARLLFFSHLLQIGYILLGILLILIVSSILIGRNVAATRRHTLLPTRETHS